MIKSIAYMNYSHFQVNSSSTIENTKNSSKITTSLKMDYLDISINYRKVKSISENIIHQIDDFFQDNYKEKN